ncbi:unnamed protein product [Brassica rapa subsp. narinosa]
MSSRFSRFKKKVFEAMVVSLGRSSSIMSIKGVYQLISKLKPFKKKAFSLFLKLVTWKVMKGGTFCVVVSRSRL